jgi:hypothetical protein
VEDTGDRGNAEDVEVGEAKSGGEGKESETERRGEGETGKGGRRRWR